MAKDTESGGSQTDKEGQPGHNDGGADEQFVAVEVDERGNPISGDGEVTGQVAKDAAAEAAGATDPEDEDEGEESDDEEEAVGHDATNESESDDERKARRKRERRAKKIQQKRMSQAKDRQLEALTRTVHTLTEEMQTLKGRTVQYDENILRQELEAVNSNLQLARDTMAKCVKAQDGEGVAEVTDATFALRERKRNIELMLNRAKQMREGGAVRTNGNGQQQPSARAAQPQQPSPAIIQNASNWASQHNWYRPDGSDRESRIVQVIDDELVTEGFDPEDSDYWAELTSRVKQQLPHRFRSQSNGNGNANRGAAVNNGNTNNGAKPRPQSGPRMASTQNGRRQLGKNEVYISPARKDAMVQAGMWDDAAKRQKMLKRYAEHDRTQAENA